jgi:hypothetical protein
VLKALGLVDRKDPATELIAKDPLNWLKLASAILNV